MNTATGEMITPIRLNHNPSKDERVSTEQYRLECLARWQQSHKQELIDKAHAEVESIREWNAYAARNRQADGLGHLNNIPESPYPLGELKHKPKSYAYHAIDFKVGLQDVLVKSTHKNTTVRHHATGHGHKRGKIRTLSRKSTQRMKIHIRNTSSENIKAFLTLTYPKDFPCDGRKVKRDLDTMLKWLKRRGVYAGIWFEEFQARGAPHFHAFLAAYPAGGVKAVAKAWFRIVGSQDRKHYLWHIGKLSGKPCLEWFRKAHAASAYATKYAAKAEQKLVPEQFRDVGRFWGYWGAARPVWRYVSGRGWYALETAGKAIINHRAQFSTAEQLGKWSDRAYYSCIMWGGAADFDVLLSAVGWTPF